MRIPRRSDSPAGPSVISVRRTGSNYGSSIAISPHSVIFYLNLIPRRPRRRTGRPSRFPSRKPKGRRQRCPAAALVSGALGRMTPNAPGTQPRSPLPPWPPAPPRSLPLSPSPRPAAPRRSLASREVTVVTLVALVPGNHPHSSGRPGHHCAISRCGTLRGRGGRATDSPASCPVPVTPGPARGSAGRSPWF